MQVDISKLNTVQIEPYDITNRDSTLYGVFTTMIRKNCDAVKYDIVDNFNINNLPAVGFEDGLSCFYYKIRTKEDIITNIKVEPSQKIKLKFNYNVVDIDENFKVYPFLLSNPEIIICVFYDQNETSDQFKISYTGYTLNYRLKQNIINPVHSLDFSQVVDYSSIYYNLDVHHSN